MAIYPLYVSQVHVSTNETFTGNARIANNKEEVPYYTQYMAISAFSIFSFILIAGYVTMSVSIPLMYFIAEHKP